MLLLILPAPPVLDQVVVNVLLVIVLNLMLVQVVDLVVMAAVVEVLMVVALPLTVVKLILLGCKVVPAEPELFMVLQLGAQEVMVVVLL
jgi:hypothetical protein